MGPGLKTSEPHAESEMMSRVLNPTAEHRVDTHVITSDNCKCQPVTIMMRSVAGDQHGLEASQQLFRGAWNLLRLRAHPIEHRQKL